MGESQPLIFTPRGAAARKIGRYSTGRTKSRYDSPCSSTGQLTAASSVPELRRRLRGEHLRSGGEHPYLPGPLAAPLEAPPPLLPAEVARLRRVFYLLDVDQDGKLTTDDLHRAMKMQGIRGVSRCDVREMLWEVQMLTPLRGRAEPFLTSENLLCLYARVKADDQNRLPRRLYHYILYRLMDRDGDGSVSADEVYTHFFTFPTGQDVIRATEELTSADASMEFGGSHFLRLMQSGALHDTFKTRPSSAPACTRSPKKLSSSTLGDWQSPKKLSAKEKYEQATQQIKTSMQVGLSWVDMRVDAKAIRRHRECTLSGVTDVWADIEKQKRDAAPQREEKRRNRRCGIMVNSFTDQDKKRLSLLQYHRESGVA